MVRIVETRNLSAAIQQRFCDRRVDGVVYDQAAIQADYPDPDDFDTDTYCAPPAERVDVGFLMEDTDI